jgi:COP9 signalosome complex subunit 2
VESSFGVSSRFSLILRSKLSRFYLETQQIEKLADEIQSLSSSADASSLIAGDDLLVDIFSLEIQLAVLRKDVVSMKKIVKKSKALSQTSMVDPRSMAIFKEAEGKMHMSERKYQDAYNNFFESFRNYQESGNSEKAKAILKYVILASMLSFSSINPFDSREAKV